MSVHQLSLMQAGLALAALSTLVPVAPAFAQEAAASPTRSAPAQAKASMNPDISLIGLFGITHFSEFEPRTFAGGHDPKESGFNLQQVELSVGHFVDPYFRLDSNLVLVNESRELKLELEEAYATTLALPGGLQGRVGKFFTAFGRFNPTHPHTWAFVDKPLVMSRFFGGDGTRDLGAQLSWLTPLPWYSELIASAQNGTDESAVSFRGSKNLAGAAQTQRSVADGVYLVRLANFFELSESASLNLGASWMSGRNKVPGQSTRILGGDVFLKFRDLSSKAYWGIQTELLQRSYGIADGESPKDWGWYFQLVRQLGGDLERWQLAARFDQVGDKHALIDGLTPLVSGGSLEPLGETDLARRVRISPAVTYLPSEFSKIRLQYGWDKPEETRAQHMVSLQFEFGIGAHGAHTVGRELTRPALTDGE
jgi:hypothetical protein